MRQSPDHLTQRNSNASAQSLAYTAADAPLQDQASSDTLESLYRNQQQLEVRQKLENERIMRLLRDVTTIDKKISELQRLHGCDLKPCFTHIRQTCLSECIKMVRIIRSSPTVAIQALHSADAMPRDRADRDAYITPTEDSTTAIQAKQRQQHTEPNGNISARSRRFLVQRSSEGRVSTSRRNDPIEDVGSDAAVINEGSTVQDQSGTATVEPACAISEYEDIRESDFSS